MTTGSFLQFLMEESSFPPAQRRHQFLHWLNQSTREEVFNAVAQFISDLDGCRLADVHSPDFECIELVNADDFSLELHFYFPASALGEADFLHLFHNHGNYHLTSYHLFGVPYGYSSFQWNIFSGSNPLDVKTSWVKPAEVVQIGTDVYHALVNPRGFFATLVLWDAESKEARNGRQFFYRSNRQWQGLHDSELPQSKTTYRNKDVRDFVDSILVEMTKETALTKLERGIQESNLALPKMNWHSEVYGIPWKEMNYRLI